MKKSELSQNPFKSRIKPDDGDGGDIAGEKESSILPTIVTDRFSVSSAGCGRGRVLSAVFPKSDSPTEITTVVGDRERKSGFLGSSVCNDYHEIPPVIKHGSKGSDLDIAANFIKIHVVEDKGIYEYHVSYDPELESVKFRKSTLRFHEGILGNVRMFDGSALFLPILLPNERTILSGHHPKYPTKPLRLTIKFVKKKKWKDCAEFYNIFFNGVMEALSMVELRRNFYDIQTVHGMPQHKLEIWPGFCISIKEEEGGLMLCLDASHKVLRTETLYDVFNGLKRAGGDWKKQFTEYAIGRVVVTRYNSMTYRIDDVAWAMTPTSTFILRDKDMTFRQYYKEQFDLDCQDLTQPLVMSRVKPKNNLPSEVIRLKSLIPEFCYVTGLATQDVSNFQMMKEVAHYTRVTPQQRVNSMNKWIQNVNENKRAQTILSDWGLKMDSVIIKLQGRLINGPTLVFSDHCTLKEAGSNFSMQAESNCFEPVHINQWALIVDQKDAQLAKRMIAIYRQAASGLGIRICDSPNIVTLLSTNVNEYRRGLQNVTTGNHGNQLAVIILPSQRDDLYAAVKKFCIVENPLPSQVILSKTLRNDKRLRSLMFKIALQINCKLGGSIWALNIPMKERIMFVGTDVHHDPARKNPSVTAMVASLNTNCTKYFSRVIFQRPHQELIDSLKAAFSEALAAYLEKNGGMPDRIIVFRDGINNRLLDTTVKHEVEQFLAAIRFMCPDCKLFTFVVVQKRLNERFFMLQNNRFENPPPGTVIDHTVTRRNFYDFFLVSQLIREGTVAPTHYIVIHDKGEIKPDLIQKFAYVTSFMYFNWPGTIRVPAVCQYAHKLAFLVGQHVKAEPSAAMEQMLYYL